MANVYSVEQVNSYIKNMFSYDTVLSRISVKGEVSNCKYHSSGHIYFTIKDKGSTLSAVMFAGNRSGLNFKMNDGMQIVVSGSISIYEAAGTYQLYAKSIQLAGSGELYERFIALRNELKEMGMFDAAYKKPIPAFSKTIGVVTAVTGAVVHDIQNVATRRNPYIQIVLYPAIVQGEMAVQSIVKGIETLDRYGVDVMIVGRGGGSIEDLWAFNEEEVARAIFNCQTPVISAVGHETDVTIADYVADMRAPTPSAAAELAVADVFALEARLEEYKIRMQRLLKERLESYRNKLSFYSMKINFLSPANLMNNKRQKLEDLRLTLLRGMESILNRRKQEFQILCARLEAHSPVAKLSGGYSYVVDGEGHTLQSIEDVTCGSDLYIHVKDGIIHGEVKDSTKMERVVEE